MKHLPMKEIGYAATFVLVALLLYGGSYMMLVSQRMNVIVGTFGVPVVDGDRIQPEYAIGGDVAVRFFSLAYEVDVRLRPEKWSIPLWPAE
jgi:hypothetical protein